MGTADRVKAEVIVAPRAVKLSEDEWIELMRTATHLYDAVNIGSIPNVYRCVGRLNRVLREAARREHAS